MTPRLQAALARARDTRAITLGAGVLREVPALFKAQFPGASARVVADPRTFNAAGADVQTALAAAGLAGAEPLVLEEEALIAEIRHVETITARLAAGPGIPVAVGAGTMNDLVKLAAERMGRPYLVVATAASMDGYTAFGASILSEGHKQTMACAAPRAVAADLDVIRRAPPPLLASGYADLMAKVVSGADWILADALGIEAIDPVAWALVQEGLPAALAEPEALTRGDTAAFGRLVEGLLMSGLAMQWTGTSRPASGAEHQFSHLWDMEHHVHEGVAPSHGFKVGVATHFIARLYEALLREPLDRLDVAVTCARWRGEPEAEEEARRLFGSEPLLALARRERAAKQITPAALAAELSRLRACWPELRERLRRQLLPSAEIRRRLAAVGAPDRPSAIGLSRERMVASAWRAQQIRRRYTVLDLCLRTGLLERFLKQYHERGDDECCRTP